MYLDAVYRVDILHAVDDDPTHFFKRFVRTHDADRIALYEDIAAGEELNSLTIRYVSTPQIIRKRRPGVGVEPCVP